MRVATWMEDMRYGDPQFPFFLAGVGPVATLCLPRVVLPPWPSPRAWGGWSSMRDSTFLADVGKSAFLASGSPPPWPVLRVGVCNSQLSPFGRAGVPVASRGCLRSPPRARCPSSPLGETFCALLQAFSPSPPSSGCRQPSSSFWSSVLAFLVDKSPPDFFLLFPLYPCNHLPPVWRLPALSSPPSTLSWNSRTSCELCQASGGRGAVSSAWWGPICLNVMMASMSFSAFPRQPDQPRLCRFNQGEYIPNHVSGLGFGQGELPR